VTLERRSPVPVGRYWVDMFRTENFDQVQAMQEWLQANTGIVRSISTEEDEESDPPRGWFLFEVTGGPEGKFLPEWVGIGFPTVAGPEVLSSDDTVQKPDVSAPPLWAVGLMVGGALLLLGTMKYVLGIGGSKQ
jgi:hypothetical protein